MITATLLLASAPHAGAQQVSHVLVVGPLADYSALVGGLWDGLKSSGFTDSRIRLDIRNAHSGDEAKAAIVPEIGTGLDAIVTIFGPSTQAANAATTQIPIVFCPVADPVASKLVASEDAPGGNLTGVASTDGEASRRRLAAFRQVLPGLKRLAVLFDPGFPPDRVQIANFEKIAPSSDVTLVSRSVDDENATVAALKSLGQKDADAVLILKEALLRHAGDELKNTALAQKLPILVGDPDLVMFPGVVAAVGPSQPELGKTCGRMTAKILNGEKPAGIPIEHPVFELVVNLKSAERLGVVVPKQGLEHAARVIR
ncbi:MAG: ABC transporter substrate-binding protein [Gammaproteobacteria bacterium]|nr:ABC transporter substrate-binding protein [Gammaproteobacteria bacterium]